MTSLFRLTAVSCFTFLTLISSGTAFADAPKEKGITPGPAHVILGDNLASIDVPKGFSFADKELAKKFLESDGGSSEGALGIIFPENQNDDASSFCIISTFEDSGYVHDKDANDLKPDEILKTYQEGTKENNPRRKELGLPPIFVGSWAEKPQYQKDKHQVVWAIEVKGEDSPTAPVTDINYNTRILGRKGVLSMNLVTSQENFPENKAKVMAILNKTEFTKGNTYGEYVAGKDKASGYGLTGLILGGGAMAAAAKMGLLGGLWKWAIALFIAGKKFLIIAVVGLGALFAKFFGKKDGGNK